VLDLGCGRARRGLEVERLEYRVRHRSRIARCSSSDPGATQ
jgi:hypothetical protein